VGMGVLPLTFKDGQNAASLGLTGTENFTIESVEGLRPGQDLIVRAVRQDGNELSFPVRVRINSEGELTYYRNGGILHYVLRNLASQSEPVAV